MASATYIAKKRKAASERGRKGVIARNQKRMREAELAGQTWTQFEYVLRFSVSPCGRMVCLQCAGRPEICGSERTVRSKIAKAIWGKRKGASK